MIQSQNSQYNRNDTKSSHSVSKANKLEAADYSNIFTDHKLMEKHFEKYGKLFFYN